MVSPPCDRRLSAELVSRRTGAAFSVSNMAENLQNSSQCDEMNEKADNIETWADALDSAADEIECEDKEPKPDAECGNCSHPFSEHKDGQECGHKDEAGAEADVCDCPEFKYKAIEEARETADNACSDLSV